MYMALFNFCACEVGIGFFGGENRAAAERAYAWRMMNGSMSMAGSGAGVKSE